MSNTLTTEARRLYMLAGKATLTIVSGKTGTRYTYRISAPKNRATGKVDFASDIRFVSVLTGPDFYTYLGIVTVDGLNFRGQKMPDAPSSKAFDWLTQNLESDRVEVLHSGRCARCARQLTVPESINTGLGPVCAGRMEAA